MKFTISVTTTFECSLERAFKTPILCDVTKIHTGYGIMPKVTHTSDDSDWGQIGSSKKIYVAKSISQKGGFASIDHIVERVENKYWKIQVDDFQSWMMGFYKFVGEWKTIEEEQNKIKVVYNYYLYSKNPILYPFNWLFARLFWKKYVKRVIDNIKKMAYDKEPYLFE